MAPPSARVWLLVLTLLAAILPAGAQTPPPGANPFLGRSAGPAAGTAAADAGPEAGRATGLPAAVGRWLVAFQRDANRAIAGHLRALRNGEGGVALLAALAFAFGYGVVHALGPGHGKFVVVSYFLGREARIGRGLLMGSQIAILHVVSAVAVVLLADWLLRRSFGGAPAEVREVRLVSYGGVLLVGLAMLVQALASLRPRARAAHGHAGHSHVGHSHEDHDHDHAHGWDPRRNLSQNLLALAVGLVPCTGAVLILLYAFANDLVGPGLVLVAAIAAGMALTMGGLGILSIFARGWVAARFARSRAAWLDPALRLVAAVAITAFGALLLASA